MSRKLARFSQWLRSRAAEPEASSPVQVLTAAAAYVPPASPQLPPELAPAEPVRGPDRRSLALSVFDPVHPVKHRGELCGRDAELEMLSTAVLEQGKHAIIYGARGSGKTSLVQVFGAQADEAGAVVVYLAAEAGVGFGELLAAYMRFIPETALTLEGRANLAARAEELKRAVRSQEMVELLQAGLVRQLVLVLDEFDRVTDRQLQVELATFMKLVADTRAPVQFVIVGIARSVDEIIVHHPSLRRHLVATPVRRLSDEGLRRLVEQGAEQCGLAFSPAAVDLIARVASGSPYHARLFALEAALGALKAEAEVVGAADVRDGLAKAIEDWSRLNVQESAFFAPLARLRPELRSSLVEVAQAAALAGELAADAPDASAPTASQADSELGLLDEVRERLSADSLAPQFLLAMLELAAPAAPPQELAAAPAEAEPVGSQPQPPEADASTAEAPIAPVGRGLNLAGYAQPARKASRREGVS
ncbi:ATP-binding protein [Phenylobacterium sp. LjRoot219]|uniref:AAA family ATPase n=1 Tax=Phenylobacterium sp. LjRoot219 TaxID=3342283 RepID=UPI003ED158DC